jgi:hypothetical protein
VDPDNAADRLVVHVTATGSKHHRADCRFLRLVSGELLQEAALSVTYLDVIDPSLDEPDLGRPFARAGWLLGDPVICRRGNERISNFHANQALIVPGKAPQSVGFFPTGFVTWIGADGEGLALGAADREVRRRRLGEPAGR